MFTTLGKRLPVIVLVLLLAPNVARAQGAAAAQGVARALRLERGAVQMAAALQAAGGCQQCGGQLLQKIKSDEDLWMHPEVSDLVKAARDGDLDVEAADFVDRFPEVATVLKYLRDLPREELPVAYAMSRAQRIANAEERLLQDTPGCSQLMSDLGFLSGLDTELRSCAVHISGTKGEATVARTMSPPDGEPPPKPPEFVLASAEAHKNAIDAGIEIIKGCDGDQACMNAGLEELTQSSRFKDMFSKLCMGQHAIALKALAFDYMVNLTSLGLAYYASGKDAEFPFGYLATTIVSRFMYTELACRAQIAGRAAPEAPGAAQDPSFFRTTFHNYVTYLKYEPLYVGVYMAMETGEDLIRGKDISETYKDVLREGAFVLVYDLAWANWKNVAVLDPLYLRAFPKMRTALNRAFENGLLGKVVSRNGKLQILYAAKALPGTLAEIVGRITVRSTDSFIFLNARQLFADYMNGGPPPEMEVVPEVPAEEVDVAGDPVPPGWFPPPAADPGGGDIQAPEPPDTNTKTDT